MIKCPVCGTMVLRSNWMGHVARDKRIFGDDIFIKTRKQNSEYYDNLKRD